MSAIAKIYGKAVLAGTKEFDNIPAKVQEDVREYILSVDEHFFDIPVEEEPVTEEPVEETSEEPAEPVESGSDEEPVEPVEEADEETSEEPTEPIADGEESAETE